jgi:hypothetical protein
MKHKYLFLLPALFIASYATAQTPYQLPNAGFEQWDGGYDSEPTHWNTFESSDGSYASMASSNHHYRRSGHRPGGNGSYYLTIYTTSIFGIKANGNMTTGRVHAGSMSAASENNYNYTQRSNSNHCQPFTATPDSMYVWVSFYAASINSVSQVEAIIHGDNDFKAPNDANDASKYKGRAVAQTARTTASDDQMNWQQLKVPFVYSGNSSANYILINLTTNNIPGAGDKHDSLSVDDIEFIYSAWLTDITINGTTIDGFSKGCLNYAIHVDDINAFGTDDIGYTTEVGDATVELSQTGIDDTTVLIRLEVTAEDCTTQKTYRITATSGTPGEPLEILNPEKNIKNSIFPNPAHGHIKVDFNGVLEVIDMQGRTVLRHQCTNGESIDISHLPKGLYAVVINGSRTSKLIIK